jgi:hypothetical protein
LRSLSALRAPVGSKVAGRVYIGTDSGSLLCLETGDNADDGWQMWGADATHNGRID